VPFAIWSTRRWRTTNSRPACYSVVTRPLANGATVGISTAGLMIERQALLAQARISGGR
jgi:hypothetical protein